MNITAHLEHVAVRLPHMTKAKRLAFNIGCAERFSRFLVLESLLAERLTQKIALCLEHLEFCKHADLASEDARQAAERRATALDELISDEQLERGANEDGDVVFEGLVLAVLSCLDEIWIETPEDSTGAAGSVLMAIEMALEDDRYACYDNPAAVDDITEREVKEQADALK